MVARATPLSRMVEAEAPAPSTKLIPSTSKGKPSTAPAITLEGKIASMMGPVEMATAAVADFVGSATLVAMIEMALGDGAAVGAE